ncbi:unnamed protein product [Schistosoma intercalatum]|nr:unnamed protein product [Schistosoma intercalatum]CAH8480134.1 unnamed protein product [Schistosoma intercalatum]
MKMQEIIFLRKKEKTKKSRRETKKRENDLYFYNFLYIKKTINFNELSCLLFFFYFFLSHYINNFYKNLTSNSCVYA